jgi:hypothetical protein
MVSTDESEEVENESEEEKKPDIKLGEIELKEGAVLVIKKTNYKGNDRIDFRVWYNTARYKGPSKQGFTLSMEKIEKFIKIVEGMKNKLKKKLKE